MLLKARAESNELRAWGILFTRMELTNKEKFHLLNLEKGYEGEVNFDLRAEEIDEERLILNDLLFEVNNSYFQIDSLIISQQAIYLLDVKNYQGDFYLESDKLYSVSSKIEYKNPVDALKRSATLLRQLLKRMNQDILVEPFVIFLNPEFTLYHAPMDQPIIHPTQVDRFIKDFNNKQSKLNDRHKKLAQDLMSFHQNENPFVRLPDYHYDQLRKGICCLHCRSFMMIKNKHNLLCKACGRHEEFEQAILRNVEEFKVLFPQRKVTTQSIYEWCKVEFNKRTIRNVLKKNYTRFGNTRETYYT